MKFLHFLLFITISHIFFGQNSNWKFYDVFKVQNSDGILLNPWSGSMNNAQVNSIDLNFDGKEDLWIFDRVAQRSIVFRQVNNQWIYDYSLEKSLPIIQDWLVLEDYDGDGRKDIFTSTIGGIKVLKNNSIAGNLSFSLIANPLLEEGFSGTINLYVSPTDVPAIKDIDGDGDVDILAFEAAGHTIEWHENTSNERKGLVFKKNVGCWGNIVFYDCSQVYVNQGCEVPITQSVASRKDLNKALHTGNTLSVLLKNGEIEVWMGHVGCSNLAYLKGIVNGGQPYFNTLVKAFPSAQPISVPFPSTSLVDVDFDGSLDVIVSPNASDNLGYEANFKESVLRLSHPKGGIQNDFLQKTSIDVGENASPLFWDFDQDGDLDLLVGNAMGEIYAFERKENTLVYKSNNFGNITSKKAGKEIKLSIAEVLGAKQLIALSQTENNPNLFVYDPVAQIWKSVSQMGLIPFDQVDWVDIDLDGKKECLVLHRSGRLDLMDLSYSADKWTFTSKQEDWGGLISQRFILQTFSIIDEKGEGQLSLFGVDRAGVFRKAYMENGKFQFIVPDETFTSLYGRNTVMKSADFTGDGKPDMLLGLSGGGIFLFENNQNSTIYNRKEAKLQAWPNPSNGMFLVRSQVNGVLDCYDALGRKILSNLEVQGNQTQLITSLVGMNGSYLLRFMGENGELETMKILIGQ